MAYCTASDIQEDFAGMSFTSGSKVTAEAVGNFITDADALINSYLAGRYSVPITGTAALATVKLLSRSLVADKVKGILEIKQATNQGANQNVRSGMSTRDVLRMLEDLRDGKAQLTDATLVTAHGGISSFNVREGKTSEFQKDEQQW